MATRAAGQAAATVIKASDLTAEQRKVRALAQRAMLGVQRQTEADIEGLLEQSSNEIILRLARERDERRRRDAAIALLLLLGGQLRGQLRDRIRKGREDARLRAHARLLAEFAALGLAPFIHANTVHHDEAPSDVSADTLAAAWKASVFYLFTDAVRRHGDLVAAVDRAAPAMGPRVRRVARTEIPQAYNDERRMGSEDAAVLLGPAAKRIGRRWDCALEACPRCLRHEGETVPLGASFSDGDEPAFMHPHCQCIETLVDLPSRS